MALNPPIAPTGKPLRVEGEYLILERKHMECEVKIPGIGKKTGKGMLYLTTARIVFVHHNFMKNDFKAFDFPLAYIKGESFEQPIFGANYLKGKAKPLYGLLPGDTDFKLWFMSGGCQTFLKLFCTVLKQIRERQRNNAVGPDPRFSEAVKNGQIGQQQAFVDPSDPSVIFISQPQETYNDVFSQPIQQSTPYYGENYANVSTTFMDMSSFQQQNQSTAIASQNSSHQQLQKPKLQDQNCCQDSDYQQQISEYQINQQQKFYEQQIQQNNQMPGYDYPTLSQVQQGNNDAYQQQQLSQQQISQQQVAAQQQYYQQNQQQQQQLNIGYYFGVPFGPTLEKNPYQ